MIWMCRVLGAALLAVVAGCYDSQKCQPELVGPAGVWLFNRRGDGTLMVNRSAPFGSGVGVPANDVPWLLTDSKLASYGLRYSRASVASCDPQLLTVDLDGEPLMPRLSYGLVDTFACNHCEAVKLPVVDVYFEWTPTRAGSSTANITWANYTKSLSLLVAETERDAPAVVLPRACRFVQRISSDAWLCDHALFISGNEVFSWPLDGLVTRLGESELVEWRAGSVWVWALDGGSPALVKEVRVGTSPIEKVVDAPSPEFWRDDVFVVGDAGLVLDADTEVVLVDDVHADVPSVRRIPFAGQVVPSGDELISFTKNGIDPMEVCIGLEPQRACETYGAYPIGSGDGQLWFSESTILSTVLGTITVSDGGLTTAVLFSGELGRVTPGVSADSFDSKLDTRPDGGVFVRRRTAISNSYTPACVVYERRNSTILPRMLPVSFSLEDWVRAPYRRPADSSDGWAWCVAPGGSTFVYAAP